MRIIAFIFARGGSRGLPGKNIRLLRGKPLIAWAIEHARAVSRIDRVIVSTDSEEIAGVAREFGAETPFLRPTELAQDNTPEWLVWRHALNFVQQQEGRLPNAMVSVPATAPLRLPCDIEKSLDVFALGNADMVVTVTDAHRSPYFNMVNILPNGNVGLVMPPDSLVARRQDAPVVYDMTTVAYVARPQFVLAQSGIFAGVVRHIHVPVERSIDIDTLLDFQIAEYLLNERSSAAQ
jgi:N-acylneuraminate cytidylyltransferase